MDKTVAALCMAENNAAEIAALRARVNARTYVVAGNTENGVTSFGTVSVKHVGAALIAFDGEPCGLYFRGDKIADGASPIIAVLPVGDGELALDGTRAAAKALLLY